MARQFIDKKESHENYFDESSDGLRNEMIVLDADSSPDPDPA